MTAMLCPVGSAFLGECISRARLPSLFISRGLSRFPLVQLCMQRLGQICPHTVAGSGLYCKTRSRASRSLPCLIRAALLCEGMCVGHVYAHGRSEERRVGKECR